MGLMSENAKKEPKRVAAEHTWNVWSNYMFCPTLCRNCNYFYEDETNWPYHCKAPTQDAISHRSKKEGFKQYDDCKYYKEKEREKEEIKTPVKAEEPENKKSPYELKEEERQRKMQEKEEREEQWRQVMKEQEKQREQEKEEAEYERTHCVVCDGIGSFVELYGKKFHRECLEDYKKTDEGKEWIAENEAMLEASRGKRQKLIESFKMLKGLEEPKLNDSDGSVWSRWIRTPDGLKYLAEYKKARLESLKTPEGQKWLSRAWDGPKWLGSPDGWEWLETEDGQTWLGSEDGEKWLSTYDAGREWIESPQGKKWIDTANGQEWLDSEDGERWLSTKTGKEWLDSPQGKKWAAEEKEIEDEVIRRLKERKIVHRIKIPVFLAIGFLSIVVNDLSGLDANIGKLFWIPVLAVVLILFIFYKMLTGIINLTYKGIYEVTDEAEMGEKILSNAGKFIMYAVGIIFVSGVHFGIFFLIRFIFFKIWGVTE